MVFATSDNGKMEEFAFLTRASKRAYCEEHGYTFFHKPLDSQVNPYWEQVRAMQEALALCVEGEWMNYTGADSYIAQGAPPCEDLLDEKFDLVISLDENGLNNNGFFLKNSEWGREFLSRVWAHKSDTKIPVWSNGDGLVAKRPNDMPHEWYEQSGFILALREMGLERVKFGYKPLINAYPSDADFEGAFIVHLPNMTNAERAEYIKEHIYDTQGAIG